MRKSQIAIRYEITSGEVEAHQQINQVTERGFCQFVMFHSLDPAGELIHS
jgi:hypothetical protein